VEEILKMFARNELKLTRDGGEFLARLCTNPKRGLLRTCTALVMHATTTHRREGGQITARLLWEACCALFQPSVIRELQNTAREEIQNFKLKTA
jgi:hypothetical protein